MNLVIFLVNVFCTVGVLFSPLVFRSDLAVEDLALCQQVAALNVRRPRPKLTVLDWMFRVVLSGCWKRWAEAVKPEAVVRWHRAGFRRQRRRLSRNGRPGRPQAEREVRELIRRMTREDPGWGAPRIHWELMKLGVEVSTTKIERT